MACAIVDRHLKKYRQRIFVLGSNLPLRSDKTEFAKIQFYVKYF